VRLLVAESLPAGTHRVSWDGRDDAGRLLPSGVYFYRLETSGLRLTRRLTFLK
jgi:flagellar hook assembly protein FlgD